MAARASRAQWFAKMTRPRSGTSAHLRAARPAALLAGKQDVLISAISQARFCHDVEIPFVDLSEECNELCGILKTK